MRAWCALKQLGVSEAGEGEAGEGWRGDWIETSEGNCEGLPIPTYGSAGRWSWLTIPNDPLITIYN